MTKRKANQGLLELENFVLKLLLSITNRMENKKMKKRKK